MAANSCDLCGRIDELFFCSYCMRCVCDNCMVLSNQCWDCWDRAVEEKASDPSFIGDEG